MARKSTGRRRWRGTENTSKAKEAKNSEVFERGSRGV